MLRGLLRTINLLEAPGQFLKDRRTRLIIALYMLRGRRRNAGARLQQGPSRRKCWRWWGPVSPCGRRRPARASERG